MYGNIDDWRAYATARGNSAPADASGADATAALTRASDYIRTRYVLRMGDVDEADPAIVEATYIAAGYELATPGFWSKTFTGSQAKVLTKVDAIQWTPVDSGVRGVDGMLPMSPAIDALLMPLTRWGMPAVYVV
ncbi:hypothetical protein [Oceaniglobus trochenteri]|uniref:hypothetical protein n=1 Tax=Oceaniglobus trochenteri TaxID=2763260 RepID=UPI001D00159C|nr:hypothetical protein [Oceaniglobus trochenteri]